MTFLSSLLAVAALATNLSGCAPEEKGELVKVSLPKIEASSAPDDQSKRVLVVINTSSSESREIGAYYRVKRQIPKENVVMISVSTTENVDVSEYQTGILGPIQAAIKNSRNQIDYIVLTSGTPIRLENDNGFSVDGHLATMNMNLSPIRELNATDINRCRNPYFGATEPFSSKKYNMYLVTRLIGYTVDDAKRLVDNSLQATAKPGPFFLDEASNRTEGGYGQLQSLMLRSFENLKQKGFEAQIDQTKEFMLPTNPVMGYISWGSNDGAFNADVYKKIQFLPGAICETFVSTSGRTFKPTTGGQSLIADLIKSGVTGVKGYVSEPYTFALARPDVLFDRYVGGFNLADSFYSASQVIKWKDIVVGDPLCQPYSKQAQSDTNR
ncbi:MAG: TIGR03790 family protein [Fimbriimonadaceae bacterium]|nr:MAG: TIGR03790 family protein [Fimbriimonadaceae bacterium]